MQEAQGAGVSEGPDANSNHTTRRAPSLHLEEERADIRVSKAPFRSRVVQHDSVTSAHGPISRDGSLFKNPQLEETDGTSHLTPKLLEHLQLMPQQRSPGTGARGGAPRAGRARAWWLRRTDYEL